MAKQKQKKDYIRLDKLLAEAGFGTRSEVKKLIAEGLVRRSGQSLTNPAERIALEQTQALTVGGTPVFWQDHYHIILNKPADTVTALNDGRYTTVYEYLEPLYIERGLRAVGRLDLDTTGLLFFTTDGELNHRLASPKYEVAKRYYFTYSGGDMGTEEVAAFAKGINLKDEGLLRPAELELLGPSEAILTITQGVYHQVKRMVAAIGREVTSLERISFGPLELSDFELEPGEYLELTEDEVRELREICKLND
ncbi:MAG: pseudouridine synthase [Eubacteriales bacterium]|nr:pseudouridine synthase [Eubacteriales bacterium]